jgi:hypothetical protein
MVFIHLQSFSRLGLALVNAITIEVLACFLGTMQIWGNVYSLIRLESFVSDVAISRSA